MDRAANAEFQPEDRGFINIEFLRLGHSTAMPLQRLALSGYLIHIPEWVWVEALVTQARESNTSVYFKENLKARPKELPW